MHRILLTAAAVLFTLAGPLPASAGPLPAFTEARITLDAFHQSVHSGTPVTATGRLEILSGGAWVPAPAEQVRVQTETYYQAQTSWSVATTSADGSFAAGLRPYEDLRVTAMWPGRDGIWAESPQRLLTVKRAMDLRITGTRLEAYSGMTVTYGKKTFPGTPGGRVELQFSPDGKAWTKIRERSTGGGPEGGFHLGHWPRSGYFRAHYPGRGDWLESTSAAYPFHVWNTRLAKLKYTKLTVRKGGKYGLDGVLERWDERNGTRRTQGFAHQKIEVHFECVRGGRPIFPTFKTDAKGRFSIRLKATCTGEFSLVYRGTPDAYFLLTDEKKVTVKK